MPADDTVRLKGAPFQPSTIENIDSAMYRFLDEEMSLFTDSNEGFKKVPIIWSGAERVNQSKRDERVRDKQGTLVLPLLTVERTSVLKSPSKKGTVWANIIPTRDEKGGTIAVARRINQAKTSNFTNAHVKRKRGQINFPMAVEKTVYETVTIPLPVYVTVTYEITIRTEYQQQMNDLMVPFATTPGGINYILIRNGEHRYEGFIQESFDINNNYSSFSNEERRLETKINIEVLGYLVGHEKNQEQPNFVYRENAVEVRIPRERIVLNEIPEHKGGKYYGLPGVGVKDDKE